jgi:hypothetical protein
MMLAISAAAHDFNDDWGDTAATAHPVSFNTNVNGRIEIDVDQDWFSFQAVHSMTQLVVTVATGTLWNSVAGLAAPGGQVTLGSTDSVASATARVAWIHVGPPATYFVRVSGFACFTTGTYTLAVSEQPFADADHDGVPDVWEVVYFGATNQPPAGSSGDYDHDGVPNIDEFLAGTDPTNGNSCLRMTGVGVTNGPHSIVWTVAPFRTYAVEVSTNLAGGGWSPLGTVTNLGDVGTLRYDDPTQPSPPLSFYRVRCLY